MLYGECRSSEIPSLTNKVVVLPIGSLEQHGHHLPLLTDSMINAEIVRRAEAELGDEALFLPVLWVGSSDHHLGLPGTVSLSNETYIRVLVDMMESLIRHGFRRIFLLNSHGGNVTPGNAAVYEVQMHHRDLPDLWLVLGTWFALAGSQIAQIEALEQKHVTHACELESSMILRLRPELVRLDQAHGAKLDFESAFWSADSRGSSRVYVPRAFEQVSVTGALGDPQKATAEKGETIYEVAAREVVSFVREFAAWQTFEPG
jgi:creatinine amidohydrolase